MQIVKLHATASTNDALKLRFRKSITPHLTALYCHEQFNGRGQRGTSWESEVGKNLTFSILVLDQIDSMNVFQINQVVSLILAKWLREQFNIQTKVKWPNDIMSVNKKIAGILIEPIFQNKNMTAAIIGIGLNVNQTEFKTLDHAISMSQITGQLFDIDQLMIQFMNFFKEKWNNGFDELAEYYNYMYKYNQKINFIKNEELLTAKVHGVDESGRLMLMHDNDVHHYRHKEISWVL